MRIIIVSPEVAVASYLCAFALCLENKYVNTDNLVRSCFKSELDSGFLNAAYYANGISIVTMSNRSSDYTCVMVYQNGTAVRKSMCYKGMSRSMEAVLVDEWKADCLNHKVEVYGNGLVSYSTELWSFHYDSQARRSSYSATA
jgi:hypothetical protein